MRTIKFAVALLALTTACENDLVGRVETVAEMESAISEVVKNGADIAIARRTVEALGFTCMPSKWAPFAGQGDSLFYSYCDGRSGGVVHRRFQLALVDSAGRYVRVHASTGLVGP